LTISGSDSDGNSASRCHVREEHRRKALRLDRFQIPAAAFDVEDRFLLAEQVFLADLDRSVAAAVQAPGTYRAEQREV